MASQTIRKNEKKITKNADKPATTRYLKVIDILRQEIIDGTFVPGDWLKTSVLAERYGVSLQPIREALQVVAGEGLIVIIPNCGARVKGLDTKRLIHIYELREAIEATLTRRFAEEASLSDIRKLEDIQKMHDNAILAQDIFSADEANLRFHDFIVNHGGNDEAIAIRERYFSLSQTIRRRIGYSQDRWVAAQKDHYDLLDAFKKRDGILSYIIASKHVNDTKNEVTRLLEEKED